MRAFKNLLPEITRPHSFYNRAQLLVTTPAFSAAVLVAAEERKDSYTDDDTTLWAMF